MGSLDGEPQEIGFGSNRSTCTASARAAILVHQFNEFNCSVEQPAIRGADPAQGHNKLDSIALTKISNAVHMSDARTPIAIGIHIWCATGPTPGGWRSASGTTGLRVQPAREPLSWYTNLMNSI